MSLTVINLPTPHLFYGTTALVTFRFLSSLVEKEMSLWKKQLQKPHYNVDLVMTIVHGTMKSMVHLLKRNLQLKFFFY